jgi:hypothetical protein
MLKQVEEVYSSACFSCFMLTFILYTPSEQLVMLEKGISPRAENEVQPQKITLH